MSEPAGPVREQASRQYARLVGQARDSFADPISNPSYTDADLAALPEDAEGASFGCGNPFGFANITAGQSVVDLGSGAGLDLLLAAERTGESGHVIGIEMTDEMIAVARRNIAKAGLDNVEVRKGFIEALPIESSSIDWVISNCVVNLSPNKQKVFAEIARVLKPGGQMLISDIVVNDMKRWMRLVAKPFNASVAGAISEGEYLGGLASVGLTDVTVLDRMVYDNDAVAHMVDSELNYDSDASPWKAKAGKLVARFAARAAAGRVVTIKVGAKRADGSGG